MPRPLARPMSTALSLVASALAMLAVLTFSVEARADGAKQGAATAHALAEQSKPAPAPQAKAHATANAKAKAQPHAKAKAKARQDEQEQAAVEAGEGSGREAREAGGHRPRVIVSA